MSDKSDNAQWRTIAYALATVSWAIVFALLVWVCDGVSQLKQDMAVVKNVLKIGSEPVGNKTTNIARTQ